MPESLFQNERSIQQMLYDRPHKESSEICPEIRLTEQDIERAEAKLLEYSDPIQPNELALVDMAAHCRVVFGDRIILPPISDEVINANVVEAKRRLYIQGSFAVSSLVSIKILRPDWYQEHPLTAEEHDMLRLSIHREGAGRRYVEAAYQILFPGSSDEAAIRQIMREDFSRRLNAFSKNQVKLVGLMEAGYLLRLAFPDEWNPSVLTPELMSGMKRQLDSYRIENGEHRFVCHAAEISVWTAQSIELARDGVVLTFAHLGTDSSHELPTERNY